MAEKFIKNINTKFAKPIDEQKNSHRNSSTYGDLEEIFCWEYFRKLKNNWSIQFNREYYQIEQGHEKQLQPGNKILIRKYLDGNIKFWSKILR